MTKRFFIVNIKLFSFNFTSLLVTTPEYTKLAKKPAESPFFKAIKAYQAPKKKKEPDWNLVKQHLPLLKSIVNKLRSCFPNDMDVQDIHSTALIGLISASQLFDPSKNISFGNYAKIRIRGTLLDEMRKLDWMSRSERMSAKNYQKAINELTSKLNKTPEDNEIEKYLNITHKEHLIIKEKAQPIYLIPLDQGMTDSDSEIINFHDIIPNLNEMDASEALESKDLKTTLRKGLDYLEDIPKKVLVLYYIENLKLLEIACALQISESRVCQIHNKALKDLKKFMSNQN